jgi:CBS domain-containing protein
MDYIYLSFNYKGKGDPVAEETKEKIRTDEFTVSGESLLSKIREIIHEGNIRRITIKNEDGLSLIEIPLTLGVIGAVLLPVWAAIGAIAALAVNFRISVEKLEEK